MAKIAHALAAAAGNAGDKNFEFVSSQISANSTPPSIPAVEDGDLLVLMVTGYVAQTSNLSGWTTIATSNSTFDLYAGYKFASASDSGTSTGVNMGTTNYGGGILMVFRPTGTINNLYMREYDLYNGDAIASASVAGANSPALVCAMTAGYQSMPSPSITQTYYDATFRADGANSDVDFFYLLDNEAVTRSVTCTTDNGSYNRAFICRFDWD
jgi:hypothetical protein